MISKVARWLMLTCVCVWELSASAAHAQGISLIRDSEIETTLRLWSEPVFAAARLDSDAVRILLVNDPGLNAFVAGGQNIFLNTGLLQAAESPSQVLGVVAHETGHIAGGHLARMGEAGRVARNTSLLATVLGIGLIALGAATGAANTGQAGGAVIVGGQSAGIRTLLAYTRAQERAADQAALTYLERAQMSAVGLLEFLRKLRGQELLVVDRQDPYVRSHPLTEDRVEFIAEHVANSEFSSVADTPEDVARHARMRAKLVGFLDRPHRVLRTHYPESDQSLPARYARAIAHMRLPDLPQSLNEMDSLLAEYPDDPYFLELKGQILFENGRIAASVPYYQAAVDRLPEDALLLAGLGRAQVETGDPALLRAAVDNLEAARRLDRENAFTWRSLATAYHGLGDAGRSSLSTGEYALLTGQAQSALLHAERAERHFPEDSRGWLQAQDIRNQAEQILELQARLGRR